MTPIHEGIAYLHPEEPFNLFTAMAAREAEREAAEEAAKELEAAQKQAEEAKIMAQRVAVGVLKPTAHKEAKPMWSLPTPKTTTKNVTFSENVEVKMLSLYEEDRAHQGDEKQN
jgi:hypothetical protein